MKRIIIITTRRAGFHAWPAAPDPVVFLRHHHRHMFHIRLGLKVTHNDRDLEFFIEQDKLNKVLDNYDMDDVGSCEMLAEHILNETPHASWCEVWEDGENGARVER